MLSGHALVAAGASRSRRTSGAAAVASEVVTVHGGPGPGDSSSGPGPDATFLTAAAIDETQAGDVVHLATAGETPSSAPTSLGSAKDRRTSDGAASRGSRVLPPTSHSRRSGLTDKTDLTGVAAQQGAADIDDEYLAVGGGGRGSWAAVE